MTNAPLLFQKEFKVSCSIDFGTSRTGAAWYTTHEGNINIPHSNIKKIKLDYNDENFKTNTAILFKKAYGNKWEPNLFGKEAEKKYLKLRPKERNNYQFFKNFKMKLYKNDEKDPKIKSYSGVKWELTRVLSGLFQFVAQKFVDSYQESTKKTLNLNEHSVQWVLTVPAIWEDQSKEIMRKAFYKSGLIPSKNSDELIFCYEPEAAALDFFYSNKNIYDLNMKKVLVIDQGGGTIDMTMIRPKIENKKITEFEILMVPKGGDFGSTYIDKQFLKFFQSFLNLNDNQFSQFKNDCPKGLLKLMFVWENIKIGILKKEMTRNDSHLIEMPKILLKYLKKTFGIKDFEYLTDLFNQMNQNSGLSKIKWNDDEDEIELKGDRVKSFFKKPLQKFRAYLNNLKQKSDILKQTEIVFFTGGLSLSDYFIESIKNLLGRNTYQYMISPYPDKSIVIGAVRYGIDPKIISIRKSSYTYGILVSPKFDSRCHDSNYKYSIQNENNQREDRCANVFQPIIFKGDTIKLSKPMKERFTPIQKNSTEMKINILRTEKKWDTNYQSIYLDSQDVIIMASFSIPIPQSNLPINKQKLEISFHFATTEIKIFMKYLPNTRFNKELSLNYDEIQKKDELLEIPKSPSIHTFLIIDTSGSMRKNDVVPYNNKFWYFQSPFPNNRFGAVLEAVGEYIIERQKVSSDDRITLIYFDDYANLIFSNEELATNLIVNFSQPNYGLTYFNEGFKLAYKNLEQINLEGRTPKMIIFSDGQNCGSNEYLHELLQGYMNGSYGRKGLHIDAILLGPKCYKEEMDEITKIGKGRSLQSETSEGLAKSFIQLAQN
ncbi:alpha kinase/elongation factor 2 kinase [Anaeramoeba flamelloides]|uniref:Alpha kinase/elongation factor 2 kinase n=1 Tax=Anaeramoeba flamelloides TaxID=1746091 RepID=A0AAV7YY66_9EUKA|nr:alpha kinase/elongation factor 2 kinase [Anaeramoeba flamelloides]